ncbi:hypothetical protein AX16_004279 [Volvariella volvacea WC 439]|nr:hypothetical protein AX16_004279 [Volvariella volvacea WC 439]
MSTSSVGLSTPNTAHERALSTQDIIASITSQFVQPLSAPLSLWTRLTVRTMRRSLLSLSLSARRFQKPALDALWRDLDTIVPLLQLLPFIAIHTVTDEHGSTKRELSIKSCYRYNLQKDWIAFDSYSCRVRSLTLTSALPVGSYTQGEIYLCTALSTLRPHQNFLPNLQTLIIEPFHLPNPAQPSLHLYFLLLSHSLITLQINDSILRADEQMGRGFLSMLALKSPRLRQLEISNCTRDTKFFSHDPVPPLPFELKRINFRGKDVTVDDSFLKMTGNSTEGVEITSLSVDHCSSISVTQRVFKGLSNWKLRPGEKGCRLYGHLEHLSIGGSLHDLHAFIGYVSSDHLREVSFKIYPDESGFSALLETRATPRGELIDFIADVTERWGVHLQSISISFNGTCGSAGVLESTFAELLFKPFLACIALRKLHFINFPWLLPGVADYTPLMDVLRNIESLHLPPQERGFSLTELRHFLPRCPKLSSLTISLDFSDITRTYHKNVPFYGLRELTVMGECPSAIFEIARKLDDTFPRLEKLSGFNSKPADSGDTATTNSSAWKFRASRWGWRDVHELLQLCQFARYAKE